MQIKAETHGKIIGGSEVDPNEHPWYARGVYGTSDSWWGCGGSLITPEFVLTAAHCNYNTGSGFQIGALCSPWGDDPSDNCGQYSETFSSKQVWTHPLYSSVGTGHDFALVHLSGRSTILPVPIDEGDTSTNYEGGETLMTIGVGNIDGANTGPGYYPDHLQHVEISYIPSDECFFTISEDMLCAADSGEGGACYGDSGGPLWDPNENKLVGVVSWGTAPCGVYPTVFARIADEIDWIRETICAYHSEPLPLLCNPDPTISPAPTDSPTETVPTVSPAPTSMDDGPYNVIHNDVIMLGINAHGHLIVPGEPDAHDGTALVGMRYNRDGGWYDSTAFGLQAEGFGVAARPQGGTSFWGGANEYKGIDNLSDEIMTATGDSATTKVKVDGKLLVTHEYAPSPDTSNLYKVTVTLRNLIDTPITDLYYRRVIDFDIPPEIYNECISIFFPDVPRCLKLTNDNGFASMNPLLFTGSIDFECPEGVGCPVYNNGPDDHGSLFDFFFTDDDGSPITLAADEEFSFEMYYGAADTKSDAYDALVDAGVEIAAYGFPPNSAGTCSGSGSPNVFMLGFSGVGGTPFESGGGGDDPMDDPSDDPVDDLVDDADSDCADWESQFALELKTDMYGSDISWEIKELDDSGDWKLVEQNMREYRNRQVYSEKVCLEKDMCYKFTIRDKYGDGLCCDQGEGYYKIFHKGRLMRDSTFEGKHKASKKFGLCPDTDIEESS